MSNSDPFLLRFQEPVQRSRSDVLSLGTMTKTSARESSDTDASMGWGDLGTNTHTEAREQSDQDSYNHMTLGTLTRTDSREASDSDPARQGWAIIPRS